MVERDLSVWSLDSDSPIWQGGAAPIDGSAGEAPAASEVANHLRIEKPGLHLIGLDGGLKEHRARPDQLAELIGAVDSMPMRVREMRSRGAETDR